MSTGAESTPFTPQRVRADVEAVLEEEPGTLAEDEDLLDRGMDSIRLMSLVEKWRTDGAQTDFVELAEDPTIAAWARLLS